MNLKQLRQHEMDQLKSDRRQYIVTTALSVFKNNGIEQTTIQEIADASQVGVATVFRYFETKKQLVIEAAQLLWESEYDTIERYLPDGYETMSGLMQLRHVLLVFKYYYQNHPEVFRFLEQFDNFVAKEHISADELVLYEERVLALQIPILRAIQKGRHDQTIRVDLDPDVLYFTLTHQLMSLISKLVLRGSILSSDLKVSGEAQIDLVLNMIIDYIRSK